MSGGKFQYFCLCCDEEDLEWFLCSDLDWWDNKDTKEMEETTFIYLTENKKGNLSRSLDILGELKRNKIRVGINKDKFGKDNLKILMEVKYKPKDLSVLVEAIEKAGGKWNQIQPKCEASTSIPPEINFDCGTLKWFPRKISDLDKAQYVWMYGSELDGDHPGFKDPVYRKRRGEFTAIANAYRHGDPIPSVEYTESEKETWRVVFQHLHPLYLKHAVQEYLESWPLLVENCGFREDNIPQLRIVSEFLQKSTGFQLRPVGGYLSPRDFLAGLAFRVFHCTQYIRHSSEPFYTPEPDCTHELLGHVPFLANADFADFLQEIGLASLGASEEDMEDLVTLYQYTIQFGLCKDDRNNVKIYGAALLSSVNELKHSIEAINKMKRFELNAVKREKRIITKFQDVYFYMASLNEAKNELRKFIKNIPRPFSISYSKESQSLTVEPNSECVSILMETLPGEKLKNCSKKGCYENIVPLTKDLLRDDSKFLKVLEKQLS